MRIAINTRFLLKDKLEGIGIYTQEIFKRVVKLLPEHEFYFLFDRKWEDEFIFSKNVTPVLVSPQARHPLLWYWWFERSVPKILTQYNIDLFISPDGYGSLQTSIPQIITIHDLAFEHYKEHTPFLVNAFYRHFVPQYCRKAHQLLAVSEFTKQDIIARYKIDEAKIHVVYNGVDSEPWTERSDFRKTDRPYFIFVGAVHPRKNVLGLLKAFEIFKTKYGHDHQLVIIGRKAWMTDILENFYGAMKFKKDVIWIEEITRNNLLDMLKNAFALVYPSFFEGFGIPVIEAMSLGVPVITSSASCMPEIAGNAALVVDPENSNEIAQSMRVMVVDDILRQQLIEKGKIRARHFSWDLSAQKVAEIIRGYK